MMLYAWTLYKNSLKIPLFYSIVNSARRPNSSDVDSSRLFEKWV